MLLGLSDYHDSIHYRDSLGLFMNKIVNCLTICRILASLTDMNDVAQNTNSIMLLNCNNYELRYVLLIKWCSSEGLKLP